MRHSIVFLKLFLLLATVVGSVQAFAAEKNNPTQDIYPAESHKVFKGPKDWFTGEVQVETLFPANDTAHYGGAYVTFQPGARSAWHMHPAGQHIVVTSGIGLVGTRDGKIVTIKAGDALWCAPGIDHWHGATSDSSMTHLVITGVLDGKNAVWKEKVTDEQYRNH